MYKYPNLQQLSIGAVSGHLSEWPTLKQEAAAVLAEVASLCAQLAEAQKKAEALDRLEEMKASARYEQEHRVWSIGALGWQPALIEAIAEAYEKSRSQERSDCLLNGEK